MLAVTGDHKCKRQNAKCKVQSGQASWLSATIDHRPSTITYDRRSTRFCLVFVLLLAAGPVRGSVVRAFSLADLYREAHRIVLGAVEDSSAAWDEAHETIYTTHTLRVERVVKGEAVSVLRVRQMGGRVGDRELTVAGNARIKPGERVLLVLRENPGFYTLVGMSQGKWSVRKIDGKDHAFRGAALGDLPKQEGEVPLEDLLERMAGKPRPEEK
jgi:hypothetical protein